MLTIIDRQVSNEDKSIKYAFINKNSNKFEAIYFDIFSPTKPFYQICISSQAGCAMGCKFCATAYGGFFENLTSDDMLEEINTVRKNLYANKIETEEKGFNIVLMGMGEPLVNYENVVQFAFQARRQYKNLKKIFISTVGIADRIYDLASLPLDLNIKLYISVHSPFNEERERIMPITKKYKIESVMDACREYAQKTNTRVKATYLLLKDVNDSEIHAHAFSNLLDPKYFEVQIQLYNETPGLPYQRVDDEIAYKFKNIIEKTGIETVVRISKGRDINGGCGQFVKKINEKTAERVLQGTHSSLLQKSISI